MGTPRVRRYGLYFLAWTAVGFFLFSQSFTQSLFTHDPTPWWAMLGSFLIGVYILAFLTPVVLWLGRRFPIERPVRIRHIAIHLFCSVIFAVVDLAIAAGVFSALGILQVLPKTFLGSWVFLLVVDFHNSVIMYWILLGIQHAIRYYRSYQERKQQALRLELRASELERQLTSAQLSTLKAQLHPHFLFNTLNAIMVLVRRERTQEAEQTLSLLSDLLRCVLDDVAAQEVTLRRELEYLRLYLAIEQIRFQDRLRIGTSIDPEVLDAAVPHMVLQPIVENAIRHGIGKSSAAGKIDIRAGRTGQSLEIKVWNDGPGLSPGGSQGQGIGLANTRARLQQLYSESSWLVVENGATGGVVATIVLPYHLATETTQTELIEVHASHDAAG
ncbi:MAG TPA: histidine kinase [Bryobacteraceae bacterium]|nr:histidine kinase [Bryobacteraceae bacterium]